MENKIVRITSFELKDFKNIENGKMNFIKKGAEEPFAHSSLSGVYGQNGSGKTAIVDAFQLLKKTLEGESLDEYAYYCISAKAESTTCRFSFLVRDEDRTISNYIYEFTLTKDRQNPDGKGCFYSAEKLQYKDLENGRSFVTILSHSDSKPDVLFQPREQLTEFVNRKNRKEFVSAKEQARKDQTSFFFSERFLSLVGNESSVKPVQKVLQRLKQFAHRNLFIFSNSNNGLVSLNLGILLSISHEGSDGESTFGEVLIGNQDELPLGSFAVVKKIILQMNSLLRVIIPGLMIEVKEEGIVKDADGEEMQRYELLSSRKGVVIPLKYESAGIRKIISILDLMISMYHHQDICVVVDELDSGVSEILLGELLSILHDHAEGQLIFTSHNLRPLEAVDEWCAFFSTANPKRRFIRFTNIKGSNNLRDMFIRAAYSGGQDEDVYEDTDRMDIIWAFSGIEEN